MKKTLLLFGLFLGVLFSALAQERTVSGIVSDETGEGLPGVTVLVKGTTNGTVTGIDGNFTLSGVTEQTVLSFSIVGYKTQDIKVGAQTKFTVQLSEDAQQLEEVVVVGYGTQIKREITGSTVSIGSDVVERQPVLNASSILQGQASGVQVTASSGAPGGGISVRVRGATSILGNNSPLYVVDGVPVVQGDLTGGGFGGQLQSALSSLNPSDIESIEVLKDAASTAIYGTRGANGVVLITTKRGKSGEAKINFAYNTGIAEPTKVLDKVTSKEYYDILNEARTNDGGTARSYADWGWDETTDNDWVEEVFRTARVSDYQLNVSGGDDRVKYFLGGSYRDEEGTMLGQKLTRYSTKINLDFKASERLHVATNFYGGYEINNRIQNDNNIYGVYSTAILTSPGIPVYDESGEYSVTPFANPVASALEPRYANSMTKIIANTNFTYNILPGLDFRTDLSLDYNILKQDHYEPATTAQGSASNGSGFYDVRDLMTWVVEPVMSYNKTVAEKHNFSLLAGATFQKRIDAFNNVTGVGFLKPSLTYITSAAQITDGTGFKSNYGLQSQFGRLNYNFDGKYLFSASLRRDGSSRFGENNKYGTFWAVSGGWIISDEEFLKNQDVLSFLKLRASHGITGNDGIGDFRYLGTWGTSANYLGAPASAPNRIANPDLKWEETAVTDLGLETGFFDNRLTVNANVFYSRTTDLLLAKPLSGVTGFTSLTANVGEMENRGLELEAVATLVNRGGFSWKVNKNISFVRNKVLKLETANADGRVDTGFASAYMEGQPLNVFYALDYLGVDPATGDAIYDDVNGDGIISDEDRKIVGDANPDYYGGFTNTLSYKGFTLDAFFQYSVGNEIYNNTRAFTENVGSSLATGASMRDRWREPGDITSVPRATNVRRGYNSQDSDRWVEDGSYMRLKNISLSYSVPRNWISKAGLSTATITATANNLLTWTNYSADPEVSVFAETNTSAGTDFLTQPQSKLYMLSVNLGF
ncbi:TonB-dependent receptor [Algivirga pacifica]|uniref:TonB-dependent receptor n=1 Tax=Algivirga pacifica TaxID=1162670 RepID=A0ABP9DM86_9BACT